MKQTHKAEVVPVSLQKHPDADALSIVPIFGVTQVVVRTQDWIERDKGIYIPCQNIVDSSRPEFAFLGQGEEVRIKPVRLRGVMSDGLLIPAPEESEIGDDFTTELGVQHWEPEIENKKQFEYGDKYQSISKYDIDGPYKIVSHFPDCPVVITEKIHGANMRVFWNGKKFFVGSRTNWRRQKTFDEHWQAFKHLQANSQVERFLQQRPFMILYGEMYGKVKGFDYGTGKKPRFIAFDIMLPNFQFMSYSDFSVSCEVYDIPQVPYLGRFQHDFATLKPYAQGKSELGDHIKEGIVVKSLTETKLPNGDRAVYKIINPDYK